MSEKTEMDLPIAVHLALRELSALPYENLSKILAQAEGGKGERNLVLASDWLEKTRETGAGGTCFSLTWWLALRLQKHSIQGNFLMGDKGRTKNIHCALNITWQGRQYLLDPGYMIFEPLPIPKAGLIAEAWVSPNEIRLEDLPDLQVWRLWSGAKGDLKPRFDFRKAPVSEAEFLEHWEASFELPMMHYPVLNRVMDGVQYYLQKRSLLIRSAEGGVMRKLGQEEMQEVLGVTFGIPKGLAQSALEIVLKRTPDFFSR